MSACTVPGSVGRLLDQTKHEIDRFSCHSECAPTIKLCLCVCVASRNHSILYFFRAKETHRTVAEGHMKHNFKQSLP